MNRALKIITALALAFIVGTSGFIGGFFVAKSPADPAFAPRSDAMAEQIEEVTTLLNDRALRPPSETSATAGAIQGILESSGDKYAVYFDKRHFEFFSEESMGEFGGIGIVLGDNEGAAYVVEVYKNTPADKGGLKAGDVFVEIDGVRRDKWTTDEVVKRVRGEEGTDVDLVMLRPKEKAHGEEYDVTLTRATIELPNIESEIKGDVGYIRLAQFNGKSAKDITDAIVRLEKQGAKSFVLDLRDNPGGLLNQAIDVTSLFLSSGSVVKVEERGRKAVESRATGRAITNAPLVVLVNENSASASEIVAGALQDHGRATLVGQTTFGKGSVQTVEELSTGGAVKFTIARYLTPKGRSLDGKGLVPDVVVKMELEKQMDEKTDTQLKRALELARKAR